MVVEEFSTTRPEIGLTVIRRWNNLYQLIGRQFREKLIFRVARLGVCDGNDVRRTAM